MLHEEPPVPNFGRPGLGPELKDGMVLAVEPMMCEGSAELTLDADGWTARTRNKKLSCHFEHMIVVGTTPEVITFWGDKV
jgi:methionyl aminopeptidase